MASALRFSKARIIEPWKGTGWPLNMFTNQNLLLEQKAYLCSRLGCKKIVRKPWRFSCGHRMCEACVKITWILPASHRICHLCKNKEHYDDRAPILSQIAIENYPTEDKNVANNSMDDESLSNVRAPAAALAKAESYLIVKAEEDLPANREVNRFVVKCLFNCSIEQGEELTIKDIEAHMEVCEYRHVPCETCDWPIKHSAREDHVCESMSTPVTNGQQGVMDAATAAGTGIVRLPDNPTAKPSKRVHSGDDGHAPVKLMALIEPVKEAQATLEAKLPPRQRQMREILLDTLQVLETRSDSNREEVKLKVQQLAQELDPEFLKTIGISDVNIYDLDDLAQKIGEKLHSLADPHEAVRPCKENAARLSAAVEEFTLRDEQWKALKRCLENLEATTCTGRMKWRVKNAFSRMSFSPTNDGLISPKCYLDISGHWMHYHALVYFNGRDEESLNHISLFFVVVQGEHDVLIDFPLSLSVTLTIRNCTQTFEAMFEKPQNGRSIIKGYPKFVPHYDIKLVPIGEQGFDDDEAIFVEVDVKHCRKPDPEPELPECADALVCQPDCSP